MNKSTATRKQRLRPQRAQGHQPHVKFNGSAETKQPSAANNVISARQLRKSYRKGKMSIEVLKGISLAVKQGEFVAIVGQSGSGKTTLLHLLGTLDVPDQGEIYFGDQRIDNLPSIRRDRIRNCDLGMIFQFYHLLPELSTLENVLMPRMIRHSTWSYLRHRRADVKRAKELLDMVGLSHRLTHKPTELSGGEMQRTAIARALVTRPKILLADEPTGNLDHENGQEVMKILRKLNREEQVTLLMVTHDGQIAEQADRIVHLADGRIRKD